MKRQDQASGIVLFLLAALLAFRVRHMPFWGAMGPREGFFPLILVMLLGGLGLVIALKAWIRDGTPTSNKILGPDRRKLILYLISFLLFGVVLDRVGFTLTMTIYLVFILKFVERQSLKLTIITVVCSIAFSYFMFVKFLGIPLPEGILSPVADYLRQLSI